MNLAKFRFKGLGYYRRDNDKIDKRYIYGATLNDEGGYNGLATLRYKHQRYFDSTSTNGVIFFHLQNMWGSTVQRVITKTSTKTILLQTVKAPKISSCMDLTVVQKMRVKVEKMKRLAYFDFMTFLCFT